MRVVVQVKEMLLGYHILCEGGGGGLTTEEIQRDAEQYMGRNFAVHIDFEVTLAYICVGSTPHGNLHLASPSRA